MSRQSELKDLFDDRNINATDDICIEADRICHETGMDADAFANEVESILTASSSDTLTEDIMKRIAMKKMPQGRKFKPKTLGGPIHHTPKKLDKKSMKHVPGYDPSLEYSHQHPEDPTVGTKRSPEAMSPEMPTKKVVQHVRPSSNKNVSGAGSASDPLNVLSEKKESSYAEREDSGKVIIQYNEELNVSSKPFLYRHNESRDGVQEVVGDKVEAPNVVVTPAISDEILETMSSISEQATQNTNITQQKKFLYSRLADRAEGIEYRLADFEQGAEVDEKQYDTTVFGRVCCNAEGGVGKLNSTSVELELSRNTGISKRIELNLQALSNVMLFPGQVIAAQGARESSTKLHVSNIVTSARLPLPRSPGSLLEKERRTREVDEQTTVPVRGGGPLRVWIAGGQFTLDNDLEFKPLLDLFQEVMAHPPDVLILVRI
eukprot:gb/GECG01011594.1/.p1 GENE.gb/GECG01011594.1/~~gb/GECG01011594.1/.p1  ORF type:complete len:433 (+),score=61.97 gb/GECG01011594.1/:1-1299(+)